MVNETVAVLRDQVENLRAELANLKARREQDMHHVEILLAERDEARRALVLQADAPALVSEVKRLTEALAAAEKQAGDIELMTRGTISGLIKQRDAAEAGLALADGINGREIKSRAAAEARIQSLLKERDEWRALAIKAQDQRDQWMSKAGELNEEVAGLRESIERADAAALSTIREVTKERDEALAKLDLANGLLRAAYATCPSLLCDAINAHLYAQPTSPHESDATRLHG